MNLSRCSNGHFYDKEKFPTCPYCAQGAGNDDGLTSVFDESQGNDIGATQPLTYNNPPQQPGRQEILFKITYRQNKI